MQIRNLLFLGALLSAASVLHAGDVDMKLTTTDGSTKMTVQDSAAVEVASVTSNGDSYFLNVNATSGTISQQWIVGDVQTVGSVAASADNYVAFPFTAGAAIGTKQVVTLAATGQVGTTTINSSNTVVGISVTSTSGGGQKIYVAVNGIVTGVTCQAALAAGAFACSGGTTAGRVGTCASLTNNSLILGHMITTCAAAGTGTIFLHQQ